MEARTPAPDPLGSPLARAAFESGTECRIVLDPEGIVVAVNEAFCRVYGIEADATVGRHFMGFSQDFDIRRFGDPLVHEAWVTAHALKGETIRDVVQGVRNRKTGREFFGRYTADPVYEHGTFVATVIAVLDVTEATRAAQSRDAALSAAEVGTWRADVEDAKVWGDANFARLCGLPESEVRDMPLARLYELIHPEDRERTTRALRTATQAGIPHEVEFRIVPPDGTVRWLVSRGMAALSDAGEPRERVGSVVDLTRQKASEATLRATTDALPAFVAAMDADLVYRFCNRRFEEWFGRSRAEIVGCPMRAIVGEKAFANLQPYLERALAGELTRYEQWLDFPQGRRYMRGAYVPAFDADGRVEGLSAMIEDATESRLAEDAHREDERQRRFLLDLGEATRPLADAEAIIGVSQRMLGEFAGASRCAYAEVGPDEDAFTILRDWSPTLPSTVGEYSLRAFGQQAESLLRVGRTLVVYDVDRDVAAGDGRETFNSIQIKAIVCGALVKGGRLVALMALHQDRPRVWRPEEVALLETVADRCWEAVERVRVERALRAANEDLERRVGERTAELTRANRDLSEFSYSVAHDLRAPLRAIVATSRMLQEDLDDRLREDERDILDRQARSALRLAKIVDDLLGFARLAKADLRREPFDLSALAERVVMEVRGRRSEPCEIVVQDGLRTVGDANLVGYALTNLIDNACKFSPRGGNVVVGQEGDAFFVRDEGVGFDMAHAHKLFVAFERLVDQEAFEGTGVGLANVKRIVERHGGRIWAESTPGRGATFWFTLG